MNASEHRSFLTEYLRPLDPLLMDPEIVEVAVNPDGRVWIERQGSAFMTPEEDVSYIASQIKHLAGQITAATGGAIGADSPLVSGKVDYKGRPLRVQVAIAPIIEGGAAISFRKYSEQALTLDAIELLHDGLVDLGAQRRALAEKIVALTEDSRVEEAMTFCVQERLNVMVSGGTSTGKTTFARALLEKVDANERIITIEDAYELFPPHTNRVMLKSDARKGAVTGKDLSAARLLEASLRMRPDRIILGELRGDECKTFLDAINTGHSGSFTTIHADTAEKAIDRLALMVMSVGINMSFEEVRRYCATSIDAVVQLGRHDGRRGIVQVFIPD